MRSFRLIPTSLGFETRLVGVCALLVGILAWLWPIGIGGMMPVGGDVTQFFMGLMGVLHESLRDGRLPAWNDLWGYGFPGLAESQMGVFYPVHIVLYRWLNTETAFVVSLVAHTLWGGVGAYWAGRRLGISRMGSALAAFSWTTCGFFLIHLAHPWGYTTGSWMPWAWGLGFSLLAHGTAAKPAYPYLLAFVLALQLLPGHFQLAFITQVGLLLMVVWVVIERLHARWSRARRSDSSGNRPSLGGAAIVLLALAWAFLLASIQLCPTARLAQLAAPRSDFGYLSDFASPPFHLVNYVAPGLFHRSPLWRPLVWDPFHAMPEEHLTYVGLVPLILACMTMMRQWRRDAGVRVLTILAGVTLVLSLGPYVPGFCYLIALPGFSFFRAPARWGLATALSLALLAGKGFDYWPEWSRPGRSLKRMAVLSIFWVGATLGIIELALLSTAKPGFPEPARGFARIFSALPWPGEPGFETVMALARKPLPDPRIASGLSQTILLRRSMQDRVFAEQRTWIYARELGETVVLILLLLLMARLSEKRPQAVGSVRGGLLLLTLLDLLVLGQHRLIDVAPWKPLVQQSPVLATLAREPRGTRIADHRLRNLPMSVGAAPISAYRTLDLPAVGSLTRLSMESLSDPRKEVEVRSALRATGTGVRLFDPVEVRSALRATGTGVRLFDPVENRLEEVLRRTISGRQTIEDPALASWLFDASWVEEQGPWARTFTIWRPEEAPARAWLVTDNKVQGAGLLDDWSGDPRVILRVIENARPLLTESRKPEEATIWVEASEPGWVIVSQLADPQWKARWTNLDRHWESDAEIRRAFRRKDEPVGWQCIEIPAPGRWVLRLDYEAQDAAIGMGISVTAWSGWLIAMLRTGFVCWRNKLVPVRNQTET